jgi:hypothetical protein
LHPLGELPEVTSKITGNVKRFVVMDGFKANVTTREGNPAGLSARFIPAKLLLIQRVGGLPEKLGKQLSGSCEIINTMLLYMCYVSDCI